MKYPLLLFIAASNFLCALPDAAPQYRRLPKEERTKADPVVEALAAYRTTAPFTQSFEEYQQDPSAYFRRRLEALEHLLDAIAASPAHAEANTLREMAQNKVAYIKALPDMTSPPINIGPIAKSAGKPIPMLEKYWIEQHDPLHRYGQEQTVYQNRWRASGVPNYFIYLDTVEGDALLNTFAPSSSMVYFTDQEEREPFKLQFSQGLAYLGGALFDTAGYPTLRNDTSVASYVVGTDGDFYVEPLGVAHFHHSTPFSGGSIVSAGEIAVVEGKIAWISNRSGHYRPSAESFQGALALLKEKIGSLAGIKAHFKIKGYSFEFLFDAEEFLSKGMNALPLPFEGCFPLHYAIDANWLEWGILASQESLRESIYNGTTPLQHAAAKGSAAWVKLLLEQGAAPNVEEARGPSALELAARSGDLDTIIVLYEATPDEVLRAKSALHSARSGNPEAMLLFEQWGHTFDSRDEDGNTVFHYAAAAPTQEALRFLYRRPYTAKMLSKTNDRKETPLHHAAAYGCALNVRRLLYKGFDTMEKDANGRTALHAAALAGNDDALEFLLEISEPSDWRIADRQGALPLHYASGAAALETLKPLIAATGSLEDRDNNGETPLFYTLRRGSKPALQNQTYLLEAGADATARNINGRTVIHKAAAQGQYMHLMTSLTYYNGLNDTTVPGDLPLHLAIRSRDIETVRYLVGHATEYQAKQPNGKGVSPLQLAQEIGDPAIIELLENLTR